MTDLGELAFLEPAIDHLRQQASADLGHAVGAYAFAYNREVHETQFFGFDAAGRNFAFRFTPEHFRQFAAHVQTVLALLPPPGDERARRDERT